jgi:mono/diheme cytochrome c family protein
MVSKAALPSPTTTAERTIVTGTGPGGQTPGGLRPAAQVRRQVLAVVAEPAEKDDLTDPGQVGGCGDRFCGQPVALLEVFRAERVDEVVDDVGPAQRGLKLEAPGGVGCHPANAATSGVSRTPRYGDDLVLAGELGHERAPDHAAGA